MPGTGPRRFEPWPWLLIGLLSAMIGSSLSLFAIASANRDGLVGDAWETGLAYNANVAARRAAEEQGLGIDLESAATPDGARVAVHLEGAPADRVTVERIRPAEAGWDRSFALRDEAGAWRGEVPLPRPGRWRLRVRADFGSAWLQREIDLWHVPGAGARR